MYTASTAFIEALQEAGVSVIFGNFGSDHPALLEAIAEARAHGRPIPQVVTAPFEMVGLHAAQGFAQVSGRAQAVVVHVDSGTLTLGGAIHNASKGRAPVLIFAGLPPFTQEGELKGSRNEFIMWLQDVADQRGIVRGYVKYEAELRTGTNIKQMVHRALQFASSDPKGPVYLTGAREVMEERVRPVKVSPSAFAPLKPAALSEDAVGDILGDLIAAKRPLVVTSYVGRQPEAVAQLVRLCRRLGIGVFESCPAAMNYPQDDELYQGVQWNEPVQNPSLAEADAILVLDSDVPWIAAHNKPSARAVIRHVDVDPLKTDIPLWYLPTVAAYTADSLTALRQLNEALERRKIDAAKVRAKRAHWAGRHAERAQRLQAAEAMPKGGITVPYLIGRLREQIGPDAICLNESVTNFPAVCNHLIRTRPGTFFTSGAGSLGWSGGAAVGTKLAAPDRDVIAVSGDGAYMFGVPGSVQWMARQYGAPYLHVVLNNRGWNAPRFSALAVHPDGYASKANSLDIAFDPPPDYAGIAAAAGGAHAAKITRPEEVDPAIAEALRVVREEKRAAVLDVWLP
jgi:acetolactate synthase-1/2/3 large subunit